MISIVVPQYPTHVQLSYSHRKKAYKSGDKLPKKFLDLNAKPVKPDEYVLKYPYSWRQGKLYDRKNKEFVAKNAYWHAQPRVMAISGNDIYARMHERKRMTVVDALKNAFLEATEKAYDTGIIPHPFPSHMFPVIVSIDLYTTIRHADWDLSNLWIYTKTFEDVLRDPFRDTGTGFIPDDNIRYVTGSGGIKFYPVAREEERQLIFHMTTDLRPEILSHVLYRSTYQPRILYSLTEVPGKAGSVTLTDNIIGISIRKNGEIVWGAVSETLNKVYWQCVRTNAWIKVDGELAEHITPQIQEYLIARNIGVS